MTQLYIVEIKGVTPYIMHAFAPDVNESTRGTVRPSVQKQCENALYKNSEGKIYVPAYQLEGSMKSESSDHKFKGRKTFKNIVSASVSVEPFELLIKPQSWEPFVIGVRIPPRTGGRVPSGRPIFKDWSLKFSIACDDSQITSEALEEILRDAGKYKGIGAWRPQLAGKYGKFEVVKFQSDGTRK